MRRLLGKLTKDVVLLIIVGLIVFVMVVTAMTAEPKCTTVKVHNESGQLNAEVCR